MSWHCIPVSSGSCVLMSGESKSDSFEHAQHGVISSQHVLALVITNMAVSVQLKGKDKTDVHRHSSQIIEPDKYETTRKINE